MPSKKIFKNDYHEKSDVDTPKITNEALIEDVPLYPHLQRTYSDSDGLNNPRFHAGYKPLPLTNGSNESKRAKIF
jgi:hypothetical protein